MAFLVWLLLCEDGKGLVKDSSVVDADQSPVRTWLKVDAHTLTQTEILATEEVAHSLNGHVQLISNAMHAALGKGVLDGTEFVESHYLAHISKGFS